MSSEAAKLGLAASVNESQSNVRYSGIYLYGSEEPAIILSRMSGRHLNRKAQMILRKKVILMVVSCESNRGL